MPSKPADAGLEASNIRSLLQVSSRRSWSTVDPVERPFGEPRSRMAHSPRRTGWAASPPTLRRPGPEERTSTAKASAWSEAGTSWEQSFPWSLRHVQGHCRLSSQGVWPASPSRTSVRAPRLDDSTRASTAAQAAASTIRDVVRAYWVISVLRSTPGHLWRRLSHETEAPVLGITIRNSRTSRAP